LGLYPRVQFSTLYKLALNLLATSALLVGAGSGISNPIGPVTNQPSVYGRVISQFIQINTNGNTVPVVFQALQDNAFYIVNSPLPLLIRSEIAPQNTYQQQTGESFGLFLKRVTIPAQPAPLPVSGSVPGFTLNIWIGYFSTRGFIDHRTLTSSMVTEILSPCSFVASGGPTIVSGTVSIPTATVAGKIVATPVPEGFTSSTNLPPVFDITGFFVSNTSSSSSVNIVEASGLPVITLFPQQSLRLPYPALESAATPTSTTVKTKASFELFFTNTSGNTVVLIVSACLTTSQNTAF